MDNDPTVETTTASPTFASAAAAMEASSASPPAETSIPETAPAATAQAGTETPPASVTPDPDTPRGTRLPDGTFAPPEARWPTILENQRTKAAKEAEDRVRQEYAWAKDVAEEQRAMLPKALQLAQWLDQDPEGAVAWLQQQVASRVSAPQEAPRPDGGIRLEDGTVVPVFTAEGQQAREKWLQQQWEAQIDQRLQPLDGIIEAYETQRASESMRGAIAKMESAHQHFAAHKADVLAEMKADPELWEFAGHYPERAMQVAFARVMETKVLPTLAGHQRSQVVTDLQRKSAATTIRPSAAAVTVPKRPKTFAEAARRMEEGG